jgi:hypothetical protein
MTNTYTVYKSQTGDVGGRYKSSSPMSAAKKAASRLFKKMDSSSRSSVKTIVFAMRETTKGSAHKVFKYVAKRVLLAKPVVLNIKGKEIVYKYKINIKADGEAPATSLEIRAKAKKTGAKKAASAKKPCKSGKVRSSVTGRCRKVATKKPCKAGKVRNPVTKRCRKVAKKPCKAGKVRNPVTKRCRKVKRGGEGEDMMEETSNGGTME